MLRRHLRGRLGLKSRPKRLDLAQKALPVATTNVQAEGHPFDIRSDPPPTSRLHRVFFTLCLGSDIQQRDLRSRGLL